MNVLGTIIPPHHFYQCLEEHLMILRNSSFLFQMRLLKPAKTTQQINQSQAQTVQLRSNLQIAPS